MTSLKYSITFYNDNHEANETQNCIPSKVQLHLNFGELEVLQGGNLYLQLYIYIYIKGEFSRGLTKKS